LCAINGSRNIEIGVVRSGGRGERRFDFPSQWRFSPSQWQIFPSLGKENQRKSKKKGFDFLGIPCPKRAFSMGYADPLALFSFLAPVAE
jgi:hypothetical protein